MTSTIIKTGLTLLLIIVLTWFGNLLNDYFVVDFLTQFFVLLRTVVKPLDFLWDFDTSFTLISWSLSIYLIYIGFKAFLTVRNIFITRE